MCNLGAVRNGDIDLRLASKQQFLLWVSHVTGNSIILNWNMVAKNLINFLTHTSDPISSITLE